jgi:hypothetical protein
MLNISEFNGSHTGELIAQKLQELIDSWSIENDKVQAFVCDEGRNIKVVSLTILPIIMRYFRHSETI